MSACCSALVAIAGSARHRAERKHRLVPVTTADTGTELEAATKYPGASAIPVSPMPPSLASGVAPLPSSSTPTISRPEWARSRTFATAPGPACFKTFVSASCTIRYAPEPIAAPISTSVDCGSARSSALLPFPHRQTKQRAKEPRRWTEAVQVLRGRRLLAGRQVLGARRQARITRSMRLRPRHQPPRQGSWAQLGLLPRPEPR